MSYGFATYAQDTFSSPGVTDVSVSVTGFSLTSSLGTASAGEFVTVLPTGVQGQTQLNSVATLFSRVDGVFGVQAAFQLLRSNPSV